MNEKIGEALPISVIEIFLKSSFGNDFQILFNKKFAGGYSNLTYFLETSVGCFVLRRPPLGANIQSAHDMSREFRVLTSLQQAGFQKIPAPVLLCTDESIIGADFYLMQHISGTILRVPMPAEQLPTEEIFRKLSKATIEQLAKLHGLELEKSGLANLGKPEGYVQRQVNGWIKRYFASQTDDIVPMVELSEWLPRHLPKEQAPAFLHNDFKYDNFILNPNDFTDIQAILDWEMATIGDPLMDLATSLSYWAEPNDPPAITNFSLTHYSGNLNRQQVVDYYAELTGKDVSEILFYYAFGCFKLAVIGQQIYARYKAGHSQDPRFANLIYMVKACASNGIRSVAKNRISGLYQESSRR